MRRWYLRPRFWLNVVIVVIVMEALVLLLNNFGSLVVPNWVYAVGWSFGNSSDPHDGFDPDEPADSFLGHYEDYCRQFLLPNESSVREFLDGRTVYNESELCHCVPQSLVGGFDVNYTATPSLESIISLHPELKPGGRWLPSNCIPRQRVAVIIPFRDRHEHLKALLYILHPMLQRQELDYTIFVVEQAEPEIFNKAMLMNAGFQEASRLAPFDCFIFHDVDMLPEDDRNFYVCSPTPRHVGAYLHNWKYQLPYGGLFGGVTAFTRAQFELVNGFSNQYYGWGGEDDDMLRRVKAKNFKIARFPPSVARFVMIKHEPDDGNPFNMRSSLGYRYRPNHYSQEGLSSLVYTRKSDEPRPLYRWLSIALPPLPKNFKGYSRRTHRSVRGNCRAVHHGFTAKFSAVLSVVCLLLFGLNL